jgi:putative transcriptional regulator
LLIAMPAMGDPNFAQSVALVCDHSSRGALGLIVNKPLPMRMGEIFEQLEIELALGPLRERQVLRGGPMQTDRGFVVHRAGGEWDSTLKVSDGQGPEEAVVALGYAGWDGGQLEDEIRANAWLSAPVDPGLIFDVPFESRWLAAGRLLGVELPRITAVDPGFRFRLEKDRSRLRRHREPHRRAPPRPAGEFRRTSLGGDRRAASRVAAGAPGGRPAV